MNDKLSQETVQQTLRPVYIVDGARTPFLKARGRPGPFSAADLAVLTGRDLLSRQTFKPHDIDEVVMGCIMPSEDEANIGRIISLRLGCGNDVPAWTVQRNCGSGMQSIDSAYKDISLGRADLVLAGGTEAMSRAPLLFRPEMVHWLASLNAAKTIGARAAVFTKFKPTYLTPIIALIRGLRDPLVGMNMGQTAEMLAYQFHITRDEMDEFALRSHLRAAKAQEEGLLESISTVYDHSGHFFDHDTGVRKDSSMEKLARLQPFFDRKFGMVTAGNSSQVTDGAALVLMASEEAVKKHKLPVLGKIVDSHWAALNPEVMGLGAIMAAAPLMLRNKLALKDLDYWEINEAFAAQVLACRRALASDEFCKENFGTSKAIGEIEEDRLNVHGGAIALGHPVGTSGTRIVLHLLNILKRNKAKRGMAAICIGGGQGGAMIVERMD